MGRLAVFIEDTKDFTETDKVGSGEVVYVHYRMRRGLFAGRRLSRFLTEKTRGCAVCCTPPVRLEECEQITGSQSELVHKLADRLVPSGTKHLVLFPGQGWHRPAILRIARKVRFLELVGDSSLETLAEEISEETGLSVPVLQEMGNRDGKEILRLPGAPPGTGVDVTAPEKNCRFLPPPSLRRVCAVTGTDGNILAGLLSFFDLPEEEIGVFLSNFTKPPMGIENVFMKK